MKKNVHEFIDELMDILLKKYAKEQSTFCDKLKSKLCGEKGRFCGNLWLTGNFHPFFARLGPKVPLEQFIGYNQSYKYCLL